MEPQIRFCTSADGTRIAYSVMGQGPPLVFVSGWGNNLELQLKHPDTRKFFLRLSREHLLVQFDCRGVGLSQRDVRDLSLETFIADINAVTGQIDLQQFDLWGLIIGAAISAAYAARYPERVSKLVLWAGYSHGEQIIGRDAMQALVELTQSNWSLARRTLADLGFPSGLTESRRWFSDLLRQTLSAETLGRYLDLQISLDIRSLLPQVKAPTLLLHRRGDCGVPIAAGRAAAALIPDARFIALDGDISHPCFGDLSYIEQALQFLEARSEMDAVSIDLPPAAEDEKTDPMIDRTISHYRILEKLGEGGMGVVYKAEDTKLKRVVALKFLPPELTRSDEWQQRFLREAQASAALAHPNICTIYEIDETEGQAFIAMECIDGSGLTDKIESGPLVVSRTFCKMLFSLAFEVRMRSESVAAVVVVMWITRRVIQVRWEGMAFHRTIFPQRIRA